MSSKIIKCKSCGNDVSSNAKSCPNCGEKNKKPLFKKWWFWLIIALIVIFAFGSSGESNNESESTTISETALSSENEVEKETTSAVSLGKLNALGSAKTYLWTMAFSYSGLIKQLEFEGYTNEEAVYAADNCGADWNEQAAKSAKQYLNTMSFSRSGLIEQLEFEGFTHEQAVYGAEAVGY